MTTKWSIVFSPHQAEKTMGQKTRFRKRPCRVCGKWFMPNPRLGDRQMTCGAKECKQRWHTAKCAEWNRQNRSYFKEIYLRSRLEPPSVDAFGPPSSPSSSRPNSSARYPSPLHLPREAVQEVMGAQNLVIIEYIVRVLLRGVQEVINAQHPVIVDESKRLVGASISRGDSQRPQSEVSSSC
jgi:hypothetical protein